MLTSKRLWSLNQRRQYLYFTIWKYFFKPFVLLNLIDFPQCNCSVHSAVSCYGAGSWLCCNVLTNCRSPRWLRPRQCRQQEVGREQRQSSREARHRTRHPRHRRHRTSGVEQEINTPGATLVPWQVSGGAASWMNIYLSAIYYVT